MRDSSPIPNPLPSFSVVTNTERMMVRKSCDSPPGNLVLESKMQNLKNVPSVQLFYLCINSEQKWQDCGQS